MRKKLPLKAATSTVASSREGPVEERVVLDKM